MSNEDDVVKKIIELIEDAYNPRETRKIIDDLYPSYNDKSKLKNLIPEIIRHFDKNKQEALRKTQFFKYFLIGQDHIKTFG